MVSLQRDIRSFISDSPTTTIIREWKAKDSELQRLLGSSDTALLETPGSAMSMKPALLPTPAGDVRKTALLPTPTLRHGAVGGVQPLLSLPTPAAPPSAKKIQDDFNLMCEYTLPELILRQYYENACHATVISQIC